MNIEEGSLNLKENISLQDLFSSPTSIQTTPLIRSVMKNVKEADITVTDAERSSMIQDRRQLSDRSPSIDTGNDTNNTDDDKERGQQMMRAYSFDSNMSSLAFGSPDEYYTMHGEQTLIKRKQISNKHSSDLGGNTYGYADDSPVDSNDSKKRGRKWQGRPGRNNRKLSWIIDKAAWKTCIRKRDTYLIDDLLCGKKLPDKNLLNKAYKVFEMDFIRRICDAICKYIVQKSSHVIQVYPATMIDKGTKHTITFVVIVQEDEDLGNEFKFHVRNTNDPAPQENVKIKFLEKEKCVVGNETDPQLLIKCIQKHSKSLRKNHTNVCRISHSKLKSIQFGKWNCYMSPIGCITLYVYVKGLIPLGENPLPKTLYIDGCEVHVDVREGFVEAYTGNKGPYDTLDHLRMGCSIGVEPPKSGEAVNGTLGGFFEMGGTDFCMSSAHVFLSANELKRLIMQETPLLERNDCAKPVYQPHDNYLIPFGRGRIAVYKEGGNGETGVDVVSILIENRNPNTGEFPMSGRVQETDKEYPHGKVYTLEEIHNVLKRDENRPFYKYGCGTGWTTGKFRLDCATFCAPHPVQDGNTDFEICLHNQFEIYSDTDKDFAGKSDSGALVFMEDGEELVAIGMVVAGMADEVCFVTPLDEIFQALKLDPKNGFKNFTTGVNNLPVNQEIAEITCDLSNVKSDINDMKSDMKDVKSEMGDIKNMLQNIHLVMQKNSDKNS